jgi:hypothetical protein
VLNRFQALSLYQQDGFLIFQRHKWNNLLKILQGESIATSPSQGSTPLGFESRKSGKQGTKETPSISKVLTQELKASLSNTLGP